MAYMIGAAYGVHKLSISKFWYLTYFTCFYWEYNCFNDIHD